MRIRRLDIFGFKSFADKTTIHFDRPIVGVVGPNGCGKSNIVDAIRWVIGEQAPKSLRAASRQDVIFSGTQTRPSGHVAEVTLTFDNAAKECPPEYVDFPEISVTRRLNRDGGSDYEINRAPARLREVQYLFLGTGAGSRAYSIIEQGKIGQMVGARADELRSMIDEAAGITKYYKKRQEAERRLDHAQTNLDRIGDTLRELKTRLNSLHRQALKAERHKAYKEEERELDMRQQSWDYKKLLDTKLALRTRILEVEEERNTTLTALAQAEAELETRSLNLEERKDQLQQEAQSLAQLDGDIRVVENQLDALVKERQNTTSRVQELENEHHLGGERRRDLENQSTELSLRLADVQESLAGQDEREQGAGAALKNINERYEALQRDIESTKQRNYQLSGDIQRLNASLEGTQRLSDQLAERSEANRREEHRLQEQLELVETRRDEALAALGGLRQMKLDLQDRKDMQENRLEEENHAYLTLRQELSRLRDTYTAAKSRLESLRELAEGMEGVSEGVKAVLQDAQTVFGRADDVELLANLLDVEPEMEKALGAALQERLEWVVVKDFEMARKGLRHLEEGNLGRGGFAQLEPPRHTLPDALPDATPLLSSVAVYPEYKGLLQRLLADVYVTDTVEQAVDLWRAHPGLVTVVTRDGRRVDRSGALIGGAGEPKSSGLLRRKNEILSLEDRVDDLETEVSRKDTQTQEQLARIEELNGLLESTRQEGFQQERKISDQEKDLNILEGEAGRLTGQLRVVDEEFERFRAQTQKFAEEKRSLTERLTEAEEQRRGMDSALLDVQQQFLDVAPERDRLIREAAEQRAELERLRQEQRHVQQNLDGVRRQLHELTERGEQVMENLRNHQMRVQEIDRERDRLNEDRDHKLSLRGEYGARLDEKRQALDEEEAGLSRKREESRQVRKHLEDLQTLNNELAVSNNELQMKIGQLETRVEERYDVTLNTEYEEYIKLDQPGEEERARIQEIRLALSKLGEVNYEAIKEHDEVQERFQFMEYQRDDLVQSMEDLRRAIQKINRTSLERFREAFETINTRFGELFPQMFGGGKAYLKLTDESDLLHSGVEINVQPPGKNVQHITLLSGGEKAMTSIALIFGIFLYKPTPYCLLDEVDAPLDAANIGRFNRMVQRISKISQFIIVTHNKKTMEISNTLYGVTMEEPGVSKLVSVNLN